MINFLFFWEQGWRSGENTRLPPMWPGFDSQTGQQMWVEFVVGFRPCFERFFSEYSAFPLSSKTNISKFQFNLNTVDEEPRYGCATANSHSFIILVLVIPMTFSFLKGLCHAILVSF